MWWTDGSCSDNGRVGAAAVGNLGNEWRSCRSYLGMGRMEVFDAELWAIGLTPEVMIQTRETVQNHGVETVAGFRDPHPAIRQTAPLSRGKGSSWRCETTEGRGISSPMAVHPRSTRSLDTRPSPGRKKQTVRRSSLEMQAEAH